MSDIDRAALADRVMRTYEIWLERCADWENTGAQHDDLGEMVVAELLRDAPTIYDEVRTERERAHALHGDKSMEGEPFDSPRPLRIIVEEIGEVARVQNEYDLGNLTADEARAEIRKELIQVAAMAVAWVEGDTDE